MLMMRELQDECLLIISNNIHRFNLAFSTTEDSYLKTNLRFLRKLHSQCLIEAATRRTGTFDKSYFDFLLNEYVEEFDTTILSESDWDAFTKRMSEIGHGFQKVRFRLPASANLEAKLDFINKTVCYLTNVKTLQIPLCCHLTTWRIVCSSCLQLKILQFVYQYEYVLNVTKSVAYFLQYMPSLEVIDCFSVPYILYELLQENLSKNWRKIYSFTLLVLLPHTRFTDAPTIRDILTLFTALCPHIKDLYLPVCSKEDLDLCFRFEELENFNADNFVKDLDLNEFLESKGGILRTLKVSNFVLSVDILLRNCPKLQNLYLKAVTFQHFKPDTTSQSLRNLRSLTLGGFSFENALTRRAVIFVLNAIQNVEELRLVDCTFEGNEEFMSELSKFCGSESLRDLAFQDCDVEFAFLETLLLTCTNLQFLRVNRCENINFNHKQLLNVISRSSKCKSHVSIFWSERKRTPVIFDVEYYLDYEAFAYLEQELVESFPTWP